MTVHVGTCGWQYADWRGRFYPEDLRQAEWLEHYAARFQTVEVDNTFYRLPAAETFAAWQRRTPADFCMALKTSRYFTHIKRMRDPEGPVRLFMERAGKLAGSLGPLLVQLPATFRADPPRLAEALDCFPRGVRLAFEPRHESWYGEATRAVLEQRNVPLCLTDTREEPNQPLWRTADWAYVRFHEGLGSPHPCYRDRALHTWAERLAEHWGDAGEVYAYFNNDPGGCAVRDARRFAGAARAAGLTPTRVPAPEETPVRTH